MADEVKSVGYRRTTSSSRLSPQTSHQQLSPSRLLPYLPVSRSADPDVASYSVRYLEHAGSVLTCNLPVLHILLVSLYTHHN